MNSISPTTEEAHMAGENLPSELEGMTLDEQETQRALWKAELSQIEDEIATLRTVLASKIRRSGELKKNLGITVWKELSEDMNQGIKNVKESNVYQTVETRVGQVTKAVTEAPIYQKTTSIIGGITGNISNKLGQMRHSESFKSFEEKVGSAYENVKIKNHIRQKIARMLECVERNFRNRFNQGIENGGHHIKDVLFKTA